MLIRRALMPIFSLLWLISLLILIVSSQDGDETICVMSGNNDDDTEECQADPTDTAEQLQGKLQQAHDFGEFLDTIFDVNDSYKGTNKTMQETLVLEAVFEYVNMDPTVLTTRTPIASNWYLELYNRLTAMAPRDSFFHVYKGRPTDDELKIVATMDRVAVQRASSNKRADDETLEDALRHEGFRRYRFRGGLTRQAQVFQIIVYNPLSYWIGFAVPNAAVLETIARYSPLIEQGAGTGYWSAVLQQHHNADVLAYDSEPPDSNNNVYFHNTYTNVLPGTCTGVFQEHPEYGKRALLLVWPNNPDNVDQPDDFHQDKLPPVWDIDCLQAYMNVGGRTVIFVGEREENVQVIPGAPRESGLTATRQFQSMLKQHFELVEQIDIPTWWSCDDATIWKRRRE